MSSPNPPLDAARDGVRVAVRVTPKSSRPGIAGVGVDAAGRAFIDVRVGAAPEGGKANAALVKLLAAAWGVPPSRLSVVAGARARRKTVRVAGDPGALMRRLGRWIGSHDA